MMGAYLSGKTLPEKYQILTNLLEQSKILAIFTLKDPKLAVPVAKALNAGGITVMEITYRTDAAASSLKHIYDANLPICVGAGTIRTIEQAESALESGAEFFVTPGFNPTIIRWAKDHEIPIFPGIDSTLGIEQALDLGLKILKYFPADIGGTKWLQAMHGPYAEVKFIATGGISLANMVEFLALPNLLAVAGSFLVPNDALQKQDFTMITELARKANESVKKQGGKT
jgi:2-dehydro-3-deoxyphosphogluconate aldolase/(4S)-4-hydroxy-2-oxoglutarate aldolase